MEIDTSMSWTLNSIEEVDNRVLRKKTPVKTPLEKAQERKDLDRPGVKEIQRQDRTN
jgi:hypothetical protein